MRLRAVLLLVLALPLGAGAAEPWMGIVMVGFSLSSVLRVMVRPEAGGA